MPKIEVYSTGVCPYCANAKMLLKNKGMDFEEIFIDQEPEQFAAMLSRSGGARTVPQIFIDDVHVGGFDDLSALNVEGELDKMLGIENGG